MKLNTLLLIVLVGAIFIISWSRSVTTISYPTSPTSPSLASTLAPRLTSTPTPSPQIRKIINHSVPFYVQAPQGQWDDPRFQDACEEITSLMAVNWAKNQTLSKSEVTEMVIKMTEYEQNTFGDYRDTSAKDTQARIFSGYFEYSKVKYVSNVSLSQIIDELYLGNIIIMPMNGQALNNPYFTPPGPERHMVLVRGYDPSTQEFITNDPGTRMGENYRYPQDIFYAAIRDYETGYHLKLLEGSKPALIISK